MSRPLRIEFEDALNQLTSLGDRVEAFNLDVDDRRAWQPLSSCAAMVGAVHQPDWFVADVQRKAGPVHSEALEVSRVYDSIVSRGEGRREADAHSASWEAP